MRSWKSICSATAAINPHKSSVSLGIQVLKEHQDTRDSDFFRIVNLDKSDQTWRPELRLQRSPDWSFPIFRNVRAVILNHSVIHLYFDFEIFL